MARFNEYPIDQSPTLDDTVLTYDRSENANKQVELSVLKNLAIADVQTALENKANTEDVKATYATIENLDNTNANVETLQVDSEAFKRDIVDLQTNDEEIKESVKTANENISTLQSDNETNKTDISSLKTRDSELETALAEKATAKELESVNAEITNLKSKDTEIENTLSTKANTEDVTNTYATIKSLESATNDIVNLKIKDTELESNIKTATDDISELKSKDTNIESEIADLKTKDSELESAISSIPKFAISVVDTLPTTDISNTTVYLVKTSETETGNLYTEYIHVKDTWEQLGTQTLDLSNYYQKNEVDTLVSDNVKALNSKDAELANSIATKLSTDDAKATYATITSLENTDKNVTALQNKDTEYDTAISDLKTADARLEGLIDDATDIETFLSNYFAVRRTGKVYTTKIYKYETSTSSTGVKMNANEGMVCVPSTNTTSGQDDYQDVGLFQHFTCNWSVDDDGFNHVDALEGQTGFTKYGKVQVGEVTMSGWFGVEDTETAILYHYSDKESELTPHPMKESINPDGTISPFMIHAKYVAGDIDGTPYSSKGLAPASGCQATQARNPVSYTGLITYMHKLGGHYCGTTSWDLFYRQLMMIIKYATTHSQSIMTGCTSYSNQDQNLVEETGVMRVVLTKAQAAGYVIGSYVSIGDIGTNTDKDRYYSYMHNKAFSVKVTKIKDVDDSNAAVYVDAPEAFDTTLTTWITTMPWHSGATDEVAGSDGSPNSNTNGKDPYKIQGIETCIGAYEALGNVVMDIVTGADGNPARDVYVCEDASTLSSNIATVRANYKKAIAQVTYTAASWKYITEETTDPDLGIMIPTKVGGGSTTGFADGLYTDAGTSGQREWLAIGSLYSGAYAGFWILVASNGWSNTDWTIVSGVSPNGTRGEYQASA